LTRPNQVEIREKITRDGRRGGYGGQAACEDVASPMRAVRVVAEAHLEDVRAKIADLEAMERVLRDTVARCASGTGSRCPVIDALYREVPSPGPRIAAVRLAAPVRSRLIPAARRRRAR